MQTHTVALVWVCRTVASNDDYTAYKSNTYSFRDNNKNNGDYAPTRLHNVGESHWPVEEALVLEHVSRMWPINCSK